LTINNFATLPGQLERPGQLKPLLDAVEGVFHIEKKTSEQEFGHLPTNAVVRSLVKQNVELLFY